MLPPPPPPLPCPLSAGWELIADVALPRETPDGQRLGGFSAAAFENDPGGGRLWLLSDAPQPLLLPVRGVGERGRAPLRIGRPLTLTSRGGEPFAQPLDGEGLVIEADTIWLVSEGRRTAERPALLLRFDRRSGRLRERIELPPEWRPGQGQGLAPNKGPESLALLPSAQLLLAAERPLRQDPTGSVRMLSYGPLAAALAGFTPLGSLSLPLEGPEWGLTELLPLSGGVGLLGLVRGFEPPGRWWAKLLLLPQPPPGAGASSAAPPLRPLQNWDLLAEGLSPDNWEGLVVGPPLSDGRPTLLLVSDDNFSPIQASRLARIAPRRQAQCR